MKKLIILISFIFFVNAIGQEKKHLPLSNSLVGIWQWSEGENEEGKLVDVRENTLNRVFKIINSDGTFFTFIISNNFYYPVISFYGTYEQEKEGEYFEFVEKKYI